MLTFGVVSHDRLCDHMSHVVGLPFLAVRQTAALMQQIRAAGQKIVVVAGPVVVHTGGVGPLSTLIREGYVDAMLCGNALGVHDIETALLGTSQIDDVFIDPHMH